MFNWLYALAQDINNFIGLLSLHQLLQQHPVYDRMSLRQLKDNKCFILPTKSENDTGIKKYPIMHLHKMLKSCITALQKVSNKLIRDLIWWENIGKAQKKWEIIFEREVVCQGILAKKKSFRAGCCKLKTVWCDRLVCCPYKSEKNKEVSS